MPPSPPPPKACQIPRRHIFALRRVPYKTYEKDGAPEDDSDEDEDIVLMDKAWHLKQQNCQDLGYVPKMVQVFSRVHHLLPPIYGCLFNKKVLVWRTKVVQCRYASSITRVRINSGPQIGQVPTQSLSLRLSRNSLVVGVGFRLQIRTCYIVKIGRSFSEKKQFAFEFG